jgi:hypothetical protein
MLSIISISSADEIKPNEIYEKAKIAYLKPECRDTIYYLEEYLKVSQPDNMKRASINSVILWCKKFLNEGVTVSKTYGIISTSDEEIITKEGKKMLHDKPKIP